MQGNNTLKIPYAMHAENRQRLITKFTRGTIPFNPETLIIILLLFIYLFSYAFTAGDIPKQSFILLEGGKSETLYDSDSGI